MTSNPLLPDRHEFQPDRSLTEPVIWIRRLLIFDRLDAGAEPVREVTFRPGLNIIATAIPEPAETRPVGHDVGKTLLTRLIRYCLGENTYAKAALRSAIEHAFPEGVVVAEIYAGGELWTVSRPLALDRRSKSHAWRGLGWEYSAAATPEPQFTDFLHVLESLTVGRFADVTLPGLERKAGWGELLSWLSRDQHCAYRDPLEWRTKWTESGSTELNAEDSSLLVRLAMDLVDVDEGKMIQRRKRMMTAKKEQTDDFHAQSATLGQKRTFLITHLNVTDDLLEADLFGSAAIRQLEGDIAHIRQQIEGLSESFGLTDLAKKRRDAAASVRTAENTVRLRKEDRGKEEQQLEKNRTATGDDLLEELGELGSGCPASHPPCPLNIENEQARERQLYRATLVRDSIRRIGELDQEIAALEDELNPLKDSLEQIRTSHRRLARKVARKESNIRTKLAKLEAIHQEAESYAPLRKSVRTLAKSIKRIKKKLEVSKKEQHSHFGWNTKKLRELNDAVRSVQQRILGRDVDPFIRIAVNRLTFSGNDEKPSPGEGMATSATLSLDLGCLQTSMTGLGFLPRLLIHDSPRGGDLEAHLYAQLFRLATEFEREFSTPPFQYILATTSHPPEELLKEPYLRLELDARDPAKLLLRRRI